MKLYKIALNCIAIFMIITITNSCDNVVNKDHSEEVSLEEKIGQMLMVGFRGSEVTEEDEIYKMISEFNLGGVVLYNKDLPSKDSLKRNVQSPKQLKKLNNRLQTISPTKLLIAIDEEGGLVSRLKPKNGFQSHKSHQSIGEINNQDSTRIWASSMADELANLGINMNFAPVVDLNINPTSPVIGNIERSFSKVSDIVVANSKIFIKEHKEKGIICVPKHFPGHGSASNKDGDTHKGLVDVSNTWNEIELEPYKELIKDNYCDIIMTAHVYNANLDTFPSTLSSKIINEVLRDELNFEGVIISDDMHMGAITSCYSFEKSIERAIKSGVDIILFSNNALPCPKEEEVEEKEDIKKEKCPCVDTPFDSTITVKAINHIKKLVSTGEISEERINRSYERITKLKNKI